MGAWQRPHPYFPIVAYIVQDMSRRVKRDWPASEVLVELGKQTSSARQSPPPRSWTPTIAPMTAGARRDSESTCAEQAPCRPCHRALASRHRDRPRPTRTNRPLHPHQDVRRSRRPIPSRSFTATRTATSRTHRSSTPRHCWSRQHPTWTHLPPHGATTTPSFPNSPSPPASLSALP